MPAIGQHRQHGRHRARRTFTTWRILTLILIGPVAAIATAGVIAAGPNANVMFGSTVHTGELPVVSLGLDHGAVIR